MKAEDMRYNRNQMASVAWRWRKNGDVTEIQRAKNTAAGESYNSLINDRYVEPGDFVRFQYFQLRYSVDPKKLKKINGSFSLEAVCDRCLFQKLSNQFQGTGLVTV